MTILALPSDVSRRSLRAVLVGSLWLRAASWATGAMLAFYLADLDSRVRPISALMVGAMTAIFYAAELLGAPIAGSASDRWGRRLFILLGPFFGLIAVQLTAATTLLPVGLLIPVLLFTRVLEGLSTASNAPATLSYLSAATSESAGLRGRVLAQYEVATVGGIAFGYVLAGQLWDRTQTFGFVLVGAIYLVSAAIFWWGVHEIDVSHPANRSESAGFRDELRLMLDPNVIRLAPAWLAVNSIIGLWFNHLPFQMAGAARFPDQLLVGGFSGSQIGGILASLVLVFSVGILLWGRTFTRLRKTTIMLWSCIGLLGTTAAIVGINHLTGLEHPALWPLVALLMLALLVMAGFTPASLGYLADISEHFAANRGTIMGLYSVLLALGQLIGGYGAGPFADWRGVDGLALLTLILTLVTVATVVRLHRLPPARDPGYLRTATHTSVAEWSPTDDGGRRTEKG